MVWLFLYINGKHDSPVLLCSCRIDFSESLRKECEENYATSKNFQHKVIYFLSELNLISSTEQNLLLLCISSSTVCSPSWTLCVTEDFHQSAGKPAQQFQFVLDPAQFTSSMVNSTNWEKHLHVAQSNWKTTLVNSPTAAHLYVRPAW